METGFRADGESGVVAGGHDEGGVGDEPIELAGTDVVIVGNAMNPADEDPATKADVDPATAVVEPAKEPKSAAKRPTEEPKPSVPPRGDLPYYQDSSLGCYWRFDLFGLLGQEEDPTVEPKPSNYSSHKQGFAAVPPVLRTRCLILSQRFLAFVNVFLICVLVLVAVRMQNTTKQKTRYFTVTASQQERYYVRRGRYSDRVFADLSIQTENETDNELDWVLISLLGALLLNTGFLICSWRGIQENKGSLRLDDPQQRNPNNLSWWQQSALLGLLLCLLACVVAPLRIGCGFCEGMVVRGLGWLGGEGLGEWGEKVVAKKNGVLAKVGLDSMHLPIGSRS